VPDPDLTTVTLKLPASVVQQLLEQLLPPDPALARDLAAITDRYILDEVHRGRLTLSDTP
jgi:hypothetical protein